MIERLHSFTTPLLIVELRGRSDVCCRVQLKSCWRVSAVVRPIWSRTDSGICSFEAKHREFLPSSPYRARSTSLASSQVDWSIVQLLMMHYPGRLPLSVHLVWHMVRTPILPLSPGMFSLIRRNISSFFCAYFRSLMSSCDVDIASLNTAPSFSMTLGVTCNAWLSKCG